jgi:hypothetical protein
LSADWVPKMLSSAVIAVASLLFTIVTILSFLSCFLFVF